jgi:hypothetical protein
MQQIRKMKMKKVNQLFDRLSFCAPEVNWHCYKMYYL